MKTQRFSSLFVLGSIAFFAACDTDSPLATEDAVDGESVPAARAAANATRTYEVTIYNDTDGQPFTPPLATTHTSRINLYDVGRRASRGVREIAENGNVPLLAGELPDVPGVADVKVVAASAPGPLMPQSSVTFTIDTYGQADYFTFVAMLICTNDGFTGVDARPLPSAVGDAIESDLRGYDAGSEVNTEDYADLVPPCPALTGQTTSKMGTGASNPALREGGVVHLHQGITGAEDLLPGLHGFGTIVGRISIKRIS